MRLKNIRSFLGRHRKETITVSVFAGVLFLVGIYVFSSMNMWGNYRTTYEKWQSSLRKDVDAALALPVVTHEERSRKMLQFQVVSSKIASAKNSLCNVSGLYSWQLYMTNVKAEKESCDQYVKAANTFSVEMQKTINYLKNEQSLAKTLASSAAQAKLTEASWDSQIETWQATVGTIKKMSVEPEFNSVKNSAADAAQSIQSSWQTLIVAHKAKDKARYLDAQAKLAQAYDTLSPVAARSAQQFEAIAKSLQATYQKAFGTATS
ncbi:MAG TPA: hypothetical protein VGO98_02850 [Candidatus Saccharimonadales bacterium]|jgi:hypothetical protein|nr:hypothetical protein [Candidatus Saccharimonadales bacterium]